MPTPTALRPLPRSIDPLDDESLPGYLLRLAHRLELSPFRLSALAGLCGRSKPTRRAELLTLSDPHTFARVTRLSLSEVTNLTLVSLADRYPPLRSRYLGKTREDQALLAERWVYLQWTRYCPQCLAGDSSTIQQDHGGPWKRTWRLPITFCCLIHHRLLEHLCPQCQEPVNSRPGTDGGTDLLIISSHATDLHPTQCRNPVAVINRKKIACGGHLSDIPSSTSALDRESLTQLLTIQAQLSRLLAHRQSDNHQLRPRNPGTAVLHRSMPGHRTHHHYLARRPPLRADTRARRDHRPPHRPTRPAHPGNPIDNSARTRPLINLLPTTIGRRGIRSPTHHRYPATDHHDRDRSHHRARRTPPTRHKHLATPIPPSRRLLLTRTARHHHHLRPNPPQPTTRPPTTPPVTNTTCK